MANEHRLKLLVDIACGEHSMRALAERSGLSMAQVSRHLQVLKLAGLIAVERDGQPAVHRLADSRALTEFAERDFEEIEHLLVSYLRRRKNRDHASPHPAPETDDLTEAI
ncbi:MAG: ArsR/SmtB family transcription factor [Rhodomicrobium sp.]